MKWLLPIILITALILCSCANGNPADTSVASDESIDATSTLSSVSATESNSSEENSNMNEETSAENTSSSDAADSSVSADETSATSFTRNDNPGVTGSFVQLWAFSGYTYKQWEKHFNYLKEADIDTVIVQWSATTPNGKFSDAYYPTTLADNNKVSGYADSPYTIPNLLRAAKSCGIKVFMGLNMSDEWWDENSVTQAWGQAQATLGISIANELYTLYKSDYPDTLYGWYFAYEYYNGIGHTDLAAEFLSAYLDGLTAIDPSMPMLMSPFVRSQVSPEDTEKELKEIFSKTRFRKGDIYCCQDSVGAGHITIDELEDYFAAIKRAVDTVDGLHFWANCECFTQNGESYSEAPIERFTKQLGIADKYVENIVTFAYSHYYSPDKSNSGNHRKYLEYIGLA